MSKVEQAEPKQVEEVPADNEKPEVREEEAARLVCTEILLQTLSHSGHYIESDEHFSLTVTLTFLIDQMGMFYSILLFSTA